MDKKLPEINTAPTWKEIEVGLAISQPGSARKYRTGDWRSSRPVVDKNRCIKCGVCYIFCPDMAVRKTEGSFFEADLFYCKGCGICAEECFTSCITMIIEEE